MVMNSVDWSAVDAQHRPFRSARTRSRWAIGFIGLVATWMALEVLVISRGFSFADRFGQISLGEYSQWQRNLNTLDGLYLASIVPAAIAFLAWLSRVVDNVPALRVGEPSVTPRWAIAAWFIPLASFIWPYRIVADLWRKVGAGRPGAKAVVAWWILWIGGGLTIRLSSLGPPAETAAALRSTLTTVTVAATGQIVAGILLIWIIRGIERGSRARAAAVASERAAAAGAIPESPVDPDGPVILDPLAVSPIVPETP
jgi:hypothetical protein